MSQDVEVKIKDVNGEEYSVKINQDAKVMDLLIKIKSEKIMASAEKLKLYDSLSILLRGKCITMEQNLYSENLPTLKDLGVDKESEMKIVFSSNKDNKLANFIKFDEIPDSFKPEDKDEITLKIKVNNKESYDIKMNKGAKISDLIAKVKSDKKIKELANGNDFFKITHFKNDKMNLQLCHTGFQNIKLKNLFKETNAILDIKFGNVDEKNYAKFDQSPSNIPIENILINAADSSNIENTNDNDTIILSIRDFGNGKEVTNLKVAKNTTMREISIELKKKYSLSDQQINGLYLSYNSGNIFYDLDETVEQVFDEKDIKRREVKTYAKGFNFNLKTSEKEADPANKNNWPFTRIIVGITALLFLVAAITTFLLYLLTTLSFSIAVPIVLTALFVICTVLFFGWKSLLPKILPKSWLKTINLGINLNEKAEDKIKDQNEKEEKNLEQYKNKNGNELY